MQKKSVLPVLPPIDQTKCTEQIAPSFGEMHIMISTNVGSRKALMHVPVQFVLDNVMTGIGAKVGVAAKQSKALRDLLSSLKSNRDMRSVIVFRVAYDQVANTVSIKNVTVKADG